MRTNRYFPLCLSSLAAMAAVIFTPNMPVAQEYLDKDICQDTSTGGPEPLGDREGHSISVGTYTCKTVDGPLAGATITGTNIWEWDGPKATLLSGHGVARKAGTTEVFRVTDGKFEVIMADGKPTGWTATGTSNSLLTSGSAAALKGKTVSWTAKPTGPHDFEITSSIK